MKILIATEKPFAPEAVDGMKKILKDEAMDLVLLEKYTDVNVLYDAVSDVDGIIIRSDKITQEVLNHAKNLKIVVRAGAGVDNVDLKACSDKNIVVMNTPGQNSNAVAELVLGFMIMMDRNQFTPSAGTELKGKTIAVHGYGHIGQLVAHTAKCLGMKVKVRDPYASEKKMHNEGCRSVKYLKTLYSGSDFVSLHIPATEQTIKSIDYDLLSCLPKGACLVNTARKEIINEDDLMRIMEERPDLKYVTDIAPSNVDVWREKFGLRFFATPKKMGAQTVEANMNAGLAAAKQVAAYLKNGDNKYQVNRF